MYTVLENLVAVGTFYQRVETGADFALAGSGDLMVVYFHFNTHFFHGLAHGGAQILK